MLRKPPPGVRRIVGVVALVTGADVDVDMVGVACAVGSRGSTVEAITAAQIEQESGAGTAERTSGTVTSGCEAVVGAAVADTAARIIGRGVIFDVNVNVFVSFILVVVVHSVVVVVESGRDKDPSTCFSLPDWRLWGWCLCPLFCCWRWNMRRKSFRSKSA